MHSGDLILHTYVDDSGVDKGIKEIEKKEVEPKEVNIEDNVDEIKEKIEKLDNEIEQLKEKREKLRDLDLKTGDNGYLENLKEQNNITSQIIEKTKEQTNLYEQLKKKYEEPINTENLSEQIEKEVQESIQVIQEMFPDLDITDLLNETPNDVKDISNILKDTGKRLSSIIKKVGRWALAVFGVRGAYNAIRNAMSVISQNDEKLKADIDYMRNALAYTLEPIVKKIVDLAKQLMTYIGYIIYRWTGKNIFENANKSLKSANGQAKKLERTLAGFDEINILNKDSSSSGGGVGPSFDLSKVDQVKVPKWVEWIANNKETILTVLGTLALTFSAVKIAKWVKNLSGLAGALGYGSGGILALLSGIALIGAGIAITIYIAKRWWDDVQKFKKSIDEIVDAGQKGQQEWIKNETDINKLIIAGNINRNYGYQKLKDSNNVLAQISGLSETLVNNAKATAENINKQVEKEYELYRTTKLTKEEKQKILNNIMQQVEYNKKVIEKLKEQGKETKGLEDTNKKIMKYGDEIYKDINGTKNSLYDINKTQLKDKDLKIKVDADTSKAEKKTSTWLKETLKSVGKIGLIISGHPGAAAAYSKLFNAKGAIYIPKLARGGIINQPGRGVPLGTAIGGERGMEGVIPLTDSQQMQLLGEAIGKYITINANITNSMNGRILSRELQRVQNESSFATNGR
jgi:hypothetical protein